MIEFLCFCEKFEVNAFTNQETNKKRVPLSERTSPFIALGKYCPMAIFVTVVCALCEIIVEIGLLPVKYRSFCGENLSHPCIAFYSN